MAKTNLKEMPVEVRSSGKEPQNDFFAAFLEYVKQHADEAIAAVEAQKMPTAYSPTITMSHWWIAGMWHSTLKKNTRPFCEILMQFWE